MTLAVGIHDGIPFELYASDPCEQPSLTRSGIHAILTGTMADFAAGHPRLSQWPELLKRDGTDATELGEIVHAMVLGVGTEFVVADPGDFLTKKGEPGKTWASAEAAEFKERCKAEGRLIIGREQNAMAMQISEKLTAALRERYGSAWDKRRCEQTVVWKRILNDRCENAPDCDHHATCWIWCRARPDAILPDGTIVDAKTTSKAVSDSELGRAIASMGLDVQHCHYQDGLSVTWQTMDVADELALSRTWRPPFNFAYVQTVPPYAVRFVDLDASKTIVGHDAHGDWVQDWVQDWPLDLTRQLIDIACERFALGLRTGEWPGEPLNASPRPPSWWIAMAEEKLGLNGEISV